VPDGFWPNGAKAAASVTFDLDAESVWVAMDSSNKFRPGVLSQGIYGPNVGVRLLLGLLDDKQVRATFFIPGINGERYPKIVRAILDHGHEVGIHGYTHTRPTLLTRSEERLELERALDVFTTAGAKVTGYRAPGWDPSDETVNLLEARGITYASQLMDDLYPYRYPGHRLIELPVHWMLDDWPHFGWHTGDSARNIKGTQEVEAIWREEFDGIRKFGACFILTLHPDVSGRPSRLALLGRIIDYIRSTNDVWLAACDEIAAHVDSRLD
jgi:peptidoglycan/xylan/chitin deacetylase (PgdA/CDA1 family)